MQSSRYAKESYRPDIDGLRAFAVLSVVLYHAFPTQVRGGYVGVDVFFVISGFLISSILLKELAEGHFSLANFYSRRIRRIFPALAVCLAVVLASGFVYLLPLELAQLGKHVFFGAAFLSNIAIWSEAGYFDVAGTLKPLLHLWSLGIEEQFYIVWPALLWTIVRVPAAGPLLTVIFTASFSVNVWLSTNSVADDFFLPIPRVWELLAGAGLAYRNRIVIAARVRFWISLGGSVALLIAAAVFTPELHFPGWPALLPVTGAVALILAGPEAIVNRTILSHRAAVFVGLISYPLYLWHWPLISYAYIFRHGDEPTPLMAIGLVAVSFCLAWATYRFIECPVRFGRHRRGRTRTVIACMAALGACGLVTWVMSGFPQRLPDIPGLDVQKINAARYDTVFQPTKGMDVLNHDNTLVAHLGEGHRKVALSGDSLLFQFGPRVQQLADEGQLAANTYFVTRGSCVPLPGIIRNDDLHCADLPAVLLDLVQREKIETVVLGGWWAAYPGRDFEIERDGKRTLLSRQDGMDAFFANLEDFVSVLQRQGAKVYLVLGVPMDRVRFSPHALVARGLTGFKIPADPLGDVPVADLRSYNAFTDQKLRIVASRTGAQLLDAFTDVCGQGDGCSPFYAVTEPKYVDGVHLRPAFVREQVHFLDVLLK